VVANLFLLPDCIECGLTSTQISYLLWLPPLLHSVNSLPWSWPQEIPSKLISAFLSSTNRTLNSPSSSCHDEYPNKHSSIFVIIYIQVHALNSVDRNKCVNNLRSFWCKKDKKCIPPEFVCDGQANCGDKKNELNFTIKENTCPGDMYMRPETGNCIYKTLLCNQERDL